MADAAAGIAEACRAGGTRLGAGVGYFLLVGLLPFVIGFVVVVAAVALTALVPGAVAYMAWIAHTDAEPAELDVPWT